MPHNRCAALVALAMAGGLACREAPRSAAAPPAAASAQLSRGDRLLLTAATIALPPDWIGPGDLPQPDSRGAKLVVAYCRQCHALPTPRAHGAADWPVVVRRMWLRMEGLPESLRVQVPSQSERSDIVQYLTTNALKVATGPLPAGMGRDAFLLACNRCHAAPDPGLHSKEEWPIVLARVERNMKRMNVLSPTGLESEDILSYLQSVAGPMRRTASSSR
jgi:cytochrome c5